MKFTFSPKLAVAMQVRGLTGAALAAKAGVTTGVITSCLRGQPCQVNSARKIAAALHSVPVLEGMAELLLV